jgi:hypothetical protein
MARKETLMPTSTLVCQAPLRITFTTGKVDEARCMVAGREFHAASTSGAVLALCRALVAAGVPDQPYAAYATGRRSASPCFTGMVHAAARLTCKGGYFVPYRETDSATPTSPSPVRAAA